MALTIHNRGQEPEIFKAVSHADFDRSWPLFMQHDPTAHLYYADVDSVADYVLLATDGGEPVAKAYSAPFAFGGKGREELPAAGWDEVVRWQHADRLAGRQRNVASALEIVVLKERQGTGIASRMVEALRDNAFRLGHGALSPVLVSSSQDVGVYVEPNVWVEHRKP